MTGFSVHPPTLTNAASTFATTADSTTTVLTSGMASSAAAATGNPGWQSGGALTACAEAWQTHLGDLVTQLHGTATALNQSADNYVSTDREHAANFNSMANGLTGGAPAGTPSSTAPGQGW